MKTAKTQLEKEEYIEIKKEWLQTLVNINDSVEERQLNVYYLFGFISSIKSIL